MVRIELSELYNKIAKRYSASIRQKALKILEAALFGKVRADKLKGVLSRYHSVRIDRELFVVTRIIPDQKLLKAYAIARRESILFEVLEKPEEARS